MSSVLVVGSIAYDFVETSSEKHDEMLGGSVTYFCMAASFFSPVHVVAVIGDDFRIDDLIFLKERQVNFDGLQQEPGKTFRWGGKYSDDFLKRETLFTHLNVFQNFNPKIPEKIKKTPFVFLANIGPELQLNVLNQMEKPKFVALDTMNFWIDRTLEPLLKVLKYIDCLIINDEEARMLAKENNLIKAIQKIQNFGPKTIIVKKGEHGAILYDKDSFFYLPAYPVKNLIDPTGAGDTFAGGFIGYLASKNNVDNQTLRNAMVFGSTLASFNVEDFGLSRLKKVSQIEVQERYQNFQKLTQFDLQD